MAIKITQQTFGKLCIKGKNLADTLDNNNRLMAPQINNKVQKMV